MTPLSDVVSDAKNYSFSSRKLSSTTEMVNVCEILEFRKRKF